MNYKIVRKKETPNVWEFWKDGKLYITIDETKETSTGNGLLTMHINFNKYPIEIDVASAIKAISEKRNETKDELAYYSQQIKEKNIHIADDAKIMFAVLDYLTCNRLFKK